MSSSNTKTNSISESISEKCIRLHREIEQFYAKMLPTPTEHAVRVQVVSRVEAFILRIWPNARIEIFGSFRTGLYLPTSDIDLLVIGNWEKLPFRTLEKKLLNSSIIEPLSVRVLETASVPILKFTDRESQVKVDIAFNQQSGVNTAELIKNYKLLFPVLPKLVLVLKQFLLQRDLHEVFTGGISSYSLVLMCISFLQLHERQHFKNANLGVLLLEFFELYGKKFNYFVTGISIRDGGRYVPRNELQCFMASDNRLPQLCIEDPLASFNNTSRSSYAILQTKQAFEYAYAVLTNALNKTTVANGKTSIVNGISMPQSILGLVVSVTDEVFEYRQWLNYKFESRLIKKIS